MPSQARPSHELVQKLVERLGLIEHPEGGFFRETYRSGAQPMASRGLTDPAGTLLKTEREGADRNVLTSIYWMPTRLHPLGWLCRNLSDHVHYFQLGSAVTYYVLLDGQLTVQRLGPDVAAGEVLQLMVPAGAWKAAELESGAYCLLGEAVAPGFDFRDFQFVAEEELASSPHFERLRRFVKPDQRRDFQRYYDAEPES